jgi:hypothetical protein
MGMFFAESARSLPSASGVIPASLAFVAVAFLGAAVTGVMGHYERRLRDLEQKLRKNGHADQGHDAEN